MNPFLTTTYINPDFFCDRESEAQLLIKNIKNQNNTAFFAQRRIGKTALIHHVFYQLNKVKSIDCLYIDVYATQNLKDLTNQLANAIYQTFPKNKSIGKRFWETIKILRPILSINEITGNPELSLDITKPQQFERTIPQLFQFLDNQNNKIVIAIDEFQQVLDYPEKNIEAILRSAIQPLKNLNFIFCGSNHRMMNYIFNDSKRPFYASTKNLKLNYIKSELYLVFISTHFKNNKVQISDEAIKRIIEFAANHTYYVQSLCHELYALDVKEINEITVLNTANNLLIENEGVYYQYRNLLTSSQWLLLIAISKQEKVYKPYAQEFINNYKLGTSAKVKRGIDALLKKEIIYYDASIEKPFYEIEDKFFMRWLATK